MENAETNPHNPLGLKTNLCIATNDMNVYDGNDWPRNVELCRDDQWIISWYKVQSVKEFKEEYPNYDIMPFKLFESKQEAYSFLLGLAADAAQELHTLVLAFSNDLEQFLRNNPEDENVQKFDKILGEFEKSTDNLQDPENL